MACVNAVTLDGLVHGVYTVSIKLILARQSEQDLERFGVSSVHSSFTERIN